jgi:hypothetical protein
MSVAKRQACSMRGWFIVLMRLIEIDMLPSANGAASHRPRVIQLLEGLAFPPPMSIPNFVALTTPVADTARLQPLADNNLGLAARVTG